MRICLRTTTVSLRRTISFALRQDPAPVAIGRIFAVRRSA